MLSSDLAKQHRSLYLVACVGNKLPQQAPAKDLYVSDWFRKARAYVEKMGHPWFILSAKHGLIHPEEEIMPYDCTLNKMNVTERKKWAEKVLRQLEPHLAEFSSIVFLAGVKYRDNLERILKTERGIEVCVPMRGMGIGKQLSWLKQQLEE